MAKRFEEIDFLRGSAIFGMILFHAFYILDFYSVISIHLYSGLWLVFVRIVQFIFLSLVGVSLAVSYQKYQPLNIKKSFVKKRILRSLTILAAALVVSGVTYVFIGSSFVKFGILHLIALCTVMFAPLADKKYLSVMLSVLVFICSFVISSRAYTSDSYFTYVLGLNGYSKGDSIDYFPLIPWSALILLGIFLGNTLYAHQKSPIKKNFTYPKMVLLFGRHSLLIYLIHVPILILFFLLFGILRIDMFI